MTPEQADDLGATGAGAGPGYGGSIARVDDVWPGWQHVIDVLGFQGGYNTNIVLISTMLLGIAAGIVGVFALLRKRSLVSDALSHATLPGIGLAFIIASWIGADGRSMPVLLLGATVTGVCGILAIQWLLRATRLREDAAIGLVLSTFFGAGAVLLSVIQGMQTGNAAGLSHLIYGQTAAMNVGDAWLMAGIAVLAVVLAVLLLKEFALVCFNDAFARVDGWPVSFIDLVMMGLIVVVTVAGLQAVGLILVVALLIIPAVAARFWTERLWLLVLVAALIGGLCGYLGSATSALLPRKPAGAVIVLIAGVLFLISMFCAPRRGVLAAAIRRLRLRIGIAVDHLLEAAYLAALDEEGALLGPAIVERLAQQRTWPLWLRWAMGLQLRRAGYGRFTTGGLRTTPAGLERGRQVARNHRLWEEYLTAHADVAPSFIDWTVDQVEHVLDPAIVADLEELLRSRGIDSHRYPVDAPGTGEAAR